MLKFFLFAIFFLVSPVSAANFNIKTDPVLKALSLEMKRSFPVLKKAEKVPLYYLGYEVFELKSYYVSSEMGAVSYENSKNSRQLDIDARFGSYDLDNTHQFKGALAADAASETSSHILPIDNDIDALRTAIWLHTDSVVKNAYENFTKVQMNKALTAEEEDKSPDFSAYKGKQFYETAELPDFDKGAIKARLNEISVKIKNYPFIFSGLAAFNAEADNRYIVSSDGAKIKTGNIYLSLSYSISSRTEDGMELERGMSYHGVKIEDFPSQEQILKDFDNSVKELMALRQAKTIEPYSGPAILTARAAGVYFHEIVGHRLEGHRQKLEESGQTFTKKLNEKITADFISVYDDPTMKNWNNTALRGHYKYDDEGVKANRVTLIENGLLKGFLMSRSPIKGFLNSNGHGRKSANNSVAVSRMGNTIVKASSTVPYAKLRAMLINEAKKQGKSFGLIFDDISGGLTAVNRGAGQTFTVNPLVVYKVYTDGRPDELVRGVNIVGTPITNFSKIIAASDDYKVFNGTCGAESGWVPVSAIAPSILISEIEVEKAQKSQERPPVLLPPLHDGKNASPSIN